jgi:ribonuclease VapC
MIFVDASALASVILSEPGSSAITDLLVEPSDQLTTSPVAVFEAVLAVARVRNMPAPVARQIGPEFYTRTRIVIVGIDERQADLAINAFHRYGKVRHPARLNMGDCFAYAAAKLRDARILFAGDDFSRTDLASALPTP